MENEVVGRLRRDFQDPEYRHVYGSGFLDSSIATQIKVLREERKWTQADLARETKMAQSRISAIEDVNYSSWSIRILSRLAKAFDLRLKVSFEEFGTLLSDFTKLNRISLERRSFEDDSAFQKPGTEHELEPQEILGACVFSATVGKLLPLSVMMAKGEEVRPEWVVQLELAEQFGLARHPQRPIGGTVGIHQVNRKPRDQTMKAANSLNEPSSQALQGTAWMTSRKPTNTHMGTAKNSRTSIPSTRTTVGLRLASGT